MTRAATRVVLEPAAQQVVEMTAQPPFLYQLGPERGRAKLDELQSEPVARPDARVKSVLVPHGPDRQIQVWIICPQGVQGNLPAVLYLHGAGWVFGGFRTHERLVQELATQSGAAVVFPEYSRSPEARYPTALEECYSIAKWITSQGAEHRIDGSRLAVAGDSVGGNMATALAMLAKERGGPKIIAQVLFYPVTDANFDTDSYREFAEGFYLSREAMMWFWDQYLPEQDRRAEPTASPLQAHHDQLSNLPPALIITAEADVLRDEGEAYAAKLRRAGVDVVGTRYQGTIHDFVMLNALGDSDAARAATTQAATMLSKALHNA